MKPIVFCADSLDGLRDFPSDARQQAGFQLDKVQHGANPDDWKPMKTVGSGVREIRIWEESGAFRVIYLAKLEDAVYVLHCFQKKSQKTKQSDIDVAKKRYRELVKG